MKIIAVDSFVIDVPQRPPIAPYASRYIATSTTGALLFRLETDSGDVGWGEAPQKLPLNIPHYEGGVAFTGREAEALRSLLLGQDAVALERLYSDWNLDGGYVQSAIEMAMWDLLGKLCQQPVWQLLGGLYRDEIEPRPVWAFVRPKKPRNCQLCRGRFYQPEIRQRHAEKTWPWSKPFATRRATS